MDKAVYLGEISTRSDGRLVVLGGRGNSASYKNQPITGVTNNDTWYDDVSDGPVTAKVTIDGQDLTAVPAWVVVGPPHYAPGVKSVRTLYDLLFDVFVQAGSLTRPQQISFADHIEPIFRRFCDLQWVNHGFATQFGWNGPNFFLSPTMRKRLADPSSRNRELRRQVYASLRDYDRDGKSPLPWPWLYGDAMASKPKSVLQHLALSPTQDWMLQRWADGAFVAGPLRQPRPTVDDAPAAEQPGLLDRAALEGCAADAFHPGIEVTWPIRHASMFSAPFRIRHRAPATAEPDYGPTLLPDEAVSATGPLQAQGPGDLTRWMAAPWQADTASCRSGYEVLANLGPRYSPYLPTFWPAQVPNHVLKLEDFEKVNTPSAGSDDSAREEAFERRATWLRGSHRHHEQAAYPDDQGLVQTRRRRGARLHRGRREVPRTDPGGVAPGTTARSGTGHSEPRQHAGARGGSARVGRGGGPLARGNARPRNRRGRVRGAGGRRSGQGDRLPRGGDHRRIPRETRPLPRRR